MRFALPAVLVAGLLAYGCVAPRERGEPAPPPRASVPAPSPAPVVAAPATTAAPSVGWADLPDTPGTWTYADAGGAQASFAGQFTLRCDRPARAVAMTRAGAAGPLTVTTTTGARTVAGAVPANDAFLDAMAFSRGHFTVDVAGQPRLVIPAHAELARVVEECRT